VDLYANELENESVVEENRFWRDYAGFVVSDRHLYREFTINRLKLKEILNKDQIIDDSVQVVSPANKQLIFDYDSSMATFNREEYIQYLLSLNDVNGVVSIDKSGQANGYALAYGGRIFQIYAGNEEIASALFHRLAMEMQTEEVVFYARDARWIAKEIAGNAKRVRLIRRFHTRLIPAQVKWDRVYALNVGLHVF